MALRILIFISPNVLRNSSTFSTVKWLRQIPNSLPPGTNTAITRKSPRSEPEISALLVAMAAHVSQFLTRLFGISAEVDALAAATADQNPVFRFKIDFIRRRVIPSLKKITPPADPQVLEAAIKELRRQAAAKSRLVLDDELATAMAAVDLMQSERAGQPSPQLESLRQWCALHLHDPAYRHWVSFRFPEAVDHFNLVQLQRPNSQSSRRVHRTRRATAAARRLCFDRSSA